MQNSTGGNVTFNSNLFRTVCIFIFYLRGLWGGRLQRMKRSLGVCRPEMGLHLLWLQKFRSLFSCSYSEELLLAHCYSGRVTDRHTQNGSMSASATATSCSSWRGFNAGGGRDIAILSLPLSPSLCSNEERYWTAPNI